MKKAIVTPLYATTKEIKSESFQYQKLSPGLLSDIFVKLLDGVNTARIEFIWCSTPRMTHHVDYLTTFVVDGATIASSKSV